MVRMSSVCIVSLSNNKQKSMCAHTPTKMGNEEEKQMQTKHVENRAENAQDISPQSALTIVTVNV